MTQRKPVRPERLRRRLAPSASTDDYEIERNRSLLDGTARYRVDETFGCDDGDGWGGRRAMRTTKVSLPKVRGL